MPDSNRPPHPCHGCALPDELMARDTLVSYLSRKFRQPCMAVSAKHSQKRMFLYNEKNPKRPLMTEPSAAMRAVSERWLLGLFLLTLPFSIRKVFTFFPLTEEGQFNEYTDLSLYLSDLTLAAFIIVFILNNKNYILSIHNWKKMFHVEHFYFFILAPLLFILWSTASIFWSENRILAFYALAKLSEGYLLYVTLILYFVPRGTFFNNEGIKNQPVLFNEDVDIDKNQNVPRGTFFSINSSKALLNAISKKCSTWNILKKDPGVEKNNQMFHVEHCKEISICSTWNIFEPLLRILIFLGLFQAFFGILQFLKQGSLGFTFLKESIFSVSDVGIAKVIIENEAFVRSYAFFPHPNILGGFLVITILITAVYPLLFHRNNQMFHVEHLKNRWFLRLALFIQLLCLICTFSKSAILGLLIGGIYLGFCIYKMFHVEHFMGNKAFESLSVPRGTFFILNSSKAILNAISKKCSTWNIFAYKPLFKKKVFIETGVNKHLENVPRGTFSQYIKMFHVEHLFVFLGIVLFIALFKAINWNYFFVQSMEERLFLMRSVWNSFQESPIIGMGIGQSVYGMHRFFDTQLLIWQFQPVHNVYLIVLSELGIIGLATFFFFIKVVFSGNVPRGTFFFKILHLYKNNEMFHVEHSEQKDLKENLKDVPRGTLEEEILTIMTKSVVISILVIMFFDHYFFDIQQGQLLFWVSFGLMASSSLIVLTKHKNVV